MTGRITLNDNIQDAIVKLVEGNPGATVVCVKILEQDKIIDPQNALGGLGVLLSLDDLRIYGSRIWMLYKDACKQSVTIMLAYLRACQLGMITRSQLDHAIDNRGDGLDSEHILVDVKKELSGFGRGEVK